MYKKSLLPILVASATFGLFGCSSESSDASSPVSMGETQEPQVRTDNNVAVMNVQEAKSHLARYRHSVVSSWQNDSTATDSAVVEIDSSLQNENFAVDAEVSVEDDSTYTVAAAGVEGEGAAWMVQIEGGAVVYSWRESASAEWKTFKTDKKVMVKERHNVRVERAAGVVVVFVNGSIVGAFQDGNGKSFKVYGRLTIGFDSMEWGKCHCHNGQVDQIGVETVDEIEDESVEDSVVVLPPDTMSVQNTASEEWIAEWNFDDPDTVGLDATGNGHDAVLGEGAVPSDSGIARFDGQSGFDIALDTALNINEFVVEARVMPSQFGTMQNILVAEPPGRGVDGWMLRIDNGVLTVHLRDTDNAYDDWSVFPGKQMVLDEWCDIRLERSADSVKLYQNGELTVSAAYEGDLTQMRYDWSIGYDGMRQAFHSRYFTGAMDYVRFGKLNAMSTGEAAPVQEIPLVAWEFNEPSFVGLDRMANNSTHYTVGNPQIADTTVTLDGNSGLQVNLSKVFRRNTFAVEARVKPAQFSEMQNIIVAEPPGRYGDGWIIRLDSGVPTVHFRDEDVDGTNWNVLPGAPLALGEWTTIRVERSADSVKVIQDGVVTASAEAKGDVSQLSYNIGIGYDAMMQQKHDRNFVGEIDYIRYYGL